MMMYCITVSINWGDESTELLKLIAEQWITIRGFSYASGFMEIYKQNKKETFQKSKGIRKKLVSGRANTLYND